jgi:hypothetical protein
MGTMLPKELLKLWELAKISVEMAIGHILQNIVKIQTAIDMINLTLRHLRADVDYLATHSGVQLPSKGKKKPAKQD